MNSKLIPTSIFLLDQDVFKYIPPGDLEWNIKLAYKAISSSIKRDVYTGEGIDIAVINKKGYKKFYKDRTYKGNRRGKRDNIHKHKERLYHGKRRKGRGKNKD